jgi:flagellar assembly protein FliH
MTAVQKFMFDHTFESDSEDSTVPDAGAASEEAAEEVEEETVDEEEVQPGYSEQQMEAAKSESFDAGRQQGADEASKTVEQETLNAVRAIVHNITELFGKQEQANSAMIKDGVGVATTIIQKLFPGLNEAVRLDEISRLIEQTLLRLIEEPRVVVRINPDLLETLGSRLDGLKAGAGYDGRIILKEDAGMDRGDCRMEWGDGSAERNATALWQSIDAIIEENIGVIERLAPADAAVDLTLNIKDAEETNTEADSTELSDTSEETAEESTQADVQDSAPEPELEHTPKIEPEPESEPKPVPAPEAESESSEEIPSEVAGFVGETETPPPEDPQNTADSAENNEEGVVAGDEADIVEPEQEQEPDLKPAPDTKSEDEPDTNDGEDETESAIAEEAAPKEENVEEALEEPTEPEDIECEDETPPGDSTDDKTPDEPAQDEDTPDKTET